VPWVNATRAADASLLQGLLQAQLVQGSLAELQNASIVRVFMPHGLGHHLGLDVHDEVRRKVPGLRLFWGREGRGLDGAAVARFRAAWGNAVRRRTLLLGWNALARLRKAWL
jgi:hypothetical protein